MLPVSVPESLPESLESLSDPVPVLEVVSVADVSVVVSVTLAVPDESALSEELESTPVIESLIDPTVTVASELDSPLGSIVIDEEPSPVAVIEPS